MGYYIRLLSPSEKVVPFDTIRKRFEFTKLVDGENLNWFKIEIYDSNNRLISLLERNSSEKTDLVRNELDEFSEEIANCYPINARDWIQAYLKRVKTIYAFQILTSVITDKGYWAVNEVKHFLGRSLGGIHQADNEGFSNEEGYHILWQFSGGVSGKWNMATLDELGKWITYPIELSDKRAVEMFKQGVIPRKPGTC